MAYERLYRKMLKRFIEIYENFSIYSFAENFYLIIDIQFLFLTTRYVTDGK